MVDGHKVQSTVKQIRLVSRNWVWWWAASWKLNSAWTLVIAVMRTWLCGTRVEAMILLYSINYYSGQ